MTEAEWRAGVDPVPMLQLLGLPRTDRRLQAYLVACGRNVLPLLHHPASHRAVEVMGLYLDGRVTDQERFEAAWSAESVVYGFGVPEREPVLAAAGRQVERLPRAELERMAGWGPTPLPESGYRLLEQATYFASYLIAVDRIEPYPACLYGQRRFLSVPVLREVFGSTPPPGAGRPNHALQRTRPREPFPG